MVASAPAVPVEKLGLVVRSVPVPCSRLTVHSGCAIGLGRFCRRVDTGDLRRASRGLRPQAGRMAGALPADLTAGS